MLVNVGGKNKKKAFKLGVLLWNKKKMLMAVVFKKKKK
jgi:hypothetical protein